MFIIISRSSQREKRKTSVSQATEKRERICLEEEVWSTSWSKEVRVKGIFESALLPTDVALTGTMWHSDVDSLRANDAGLFHKEELE